jgi:hypothetical protein
MRIPTWHRIDHISWLIELFLKTNFLPNTKLGDHGKAHNRWFILFYHAWGPAWIEIHWSSIWLRARSHMTSHYTWGSVTTIYDFGGALGRLLDTFFWALTNSWSRLLARVWSDANPLQFKVVCMQNSSQCAWEKHGSMGEKNRTHELKEQSRLIYYLNSLAPFAWRKPTLLCNVKSANNRVIFYET